MVWARGLRKSYGDVEAVRGIDLDVRPGESFGFLGPNGAGKSSTMRMVAAVSAPSAGELQGMLDAFLRYGSTRVARGARDPAVGQQDGAVVHRDAQVLFADDVLGLRRRQVGEPSEDGAGEAHAPSGYEARRCGHASPG